MTEGPYELPDGWRWVRLGEVVEHRRRSIDPRCFPDETFILYSIPSYDNGMKPEKVNGAQIGSSKLLVETGSCLFSKLNPRLPRAWIVDETDSGYRKIASTEFMPLKPRDDALDLVYLGRLLVSEAFLKQVRGVVTGATGSRQRLKPDVVLGALIPLPPVTEQRRIVARIEELMALVREARRLREEAKKDAERLMHAALAEVFPRPGADLAPGWRWVKLREVAKAVNGFGFPKQFQGEKTLPIPFIKVSDLNRPDNEVEVTYAENYVDDAILRTIGARAYEHGTIIFPKIGGAIATNKKRKLGVRAAFDNNLMGVIADTTRLDHDYLLHFLNSVDLQQMSQVGPVPSIRQSTVEALPMPLCSIDEQRRIVAYLDSVQAKVKVLKDAQSATEAEFQRLEQAILDKAFRGEL